MGLGLLVCLSGCKKKVEDFAFSGVAIDRVECTMMTQSISEQDWGFVIELTTPSDIGGDYYDAQSNVHHNCVLLYRTRYNFVENDKVSGRMYLDDEYSKSYCAYHSRLGLPEGVCSQLD